MSGWRADGRTAPTLWRSCPHEVVIVGRCFVCRALAIEGYVQSKHDSHGGVPLGSPLLQPPMTKTTQGNLGKMRGDGTSRARFNPSLTGGNR